MAAGIKFQITLSEITMDMLSDLCEKKGLSKSVVIALAIEKLAKGESDEMK